MKYVIIIVSIVFSGCASSPLDKKRNNVLDCTKDLIATDASATEAFEVCRQVYNLNVKVNHGTSSVQSK